MHADETLINIRGMNQYVWVFTDGNYVILHIAPCGRTLQPYPLDQGPARGALEAYVPRLILSPSS